MKNILFNYAALAFAAEDPSPPVLFSVLVKATYNIYNIASNISKVFSEWGYFASW